MKKLIITADDYGMSEAVNKAIEKGMRAGLITATNVMTNMPYYKAAKKLMGNDRTSVGLHWVLTCGRPVLPACEIPSLVKPDGEFYSNSEFRRRYRSRRIDEEELKKELIAQYQLFVSDIGTPDYWNTHENFHVGFGIYGWMVQLALDLGIHRMRSHQRIYVPGSDRSDLMPLSWRLVEPVKSSLLDVWQGNAHRKGVKSPEGLILCRNHSDLYKPDYVFENIQWKKHRIGEYVIHPATEVDSPLFGEIVERRIWEYKTFTSTETKKILHHAGIRRATYKDL